MWYRWGEKTLGKFKSVIEWIFVPLPVYGIAGFEGTRSRAEETCISVLPRNHSFHWVDSWEMPVQVVTIHKSYRSAKSIQKLGCVPTSGPVDSTELYPRICFFWSTLPVLLLPSHFGTCILQSFDLVLCSFITSGYSWMSQMPTPRKVRHLFFFQISSHSFAKHQLCSINHVFKFNQCCYTTLHPKSARPGVAM